MCSCSLKTEANIEAMCSIDERWLLIETDCPWCEVKASHAGHKLIKSRMPCIKKETWRGELAVKGRNEPAALVQVMEIVASARNRDIYELADVIRRNTFRLFKI